MSRLLYIKASPRGAASQSSAVADAYLAALREQLPDLIVDTLDLAQEKIPDFGGDKVAAKMAVITGLLWGLDPERGYFGLLKNKKAVLALTSGAYGPLMPSPAFGVDHHSTYLRDWLSQAGVTDVEEIRFQPTLLNPDPEGSFKAAVAAARSLAARA